MNEDIEILMNEDKVPSNLDEAVNIIKEALSPEAIEFVKTSVSTSVHFDFGRYIRNNWSLWEKESVLVKWFEKEYGITHADDISGIILECVWDDVKGNPRKDREKAEEFKEYWRVMDEAAAEGRDVELEMFKDGSIKARKGKKKDER